MSRISSWPLWTAPRHVVASVLSVELTAVLLVVLTAVTDPVRSGDLLVAGVLIAFGAVHTEVAIRVERSRRQVTGAVHVDLSSVWTFAAALVVSPAAAVGVAVAVQLHLWARAWRPRVPLYRQLFSIATIALACLAVGGVVALVDIGTVPGSVGLLVVSVAVLAYTTVNSGLVAGAIMVSSPQPDLSDAIGDLEDNLLEIATLYLGALAALAVLAHPVLGAALLPAVVLLHRAVLVRHLRQAAETDPKTGLLNAAAWHTRAAQSLAAALRGGEQRAVLIADLDRFKAVNDLHGHLVGDRVLNAVAGCLRAELRDRDLIGRFGGEEFVMLLDDLGDVWAVAERVRRRVDALQVVVPTADGSMTVGGLSVSVGAARHPEHGVDLAALLHSADIALYAAKRAGRNAVRLAAPVGGAPVDSPLTRG